MLVQLLAALSEPTSALDSLHARFSALPLPAGIPHHLIDVMEPTGEFSAGDFYDRARRATTDILAVRCLGLGRNIAGGTF